MSKRSTNPLRVHGDRFALAGMLDFAVNVWPTPRSDRLRARLIDALEVTGYPEESAARLAIARRHRRPVAEVLTLGGACEAFWLLAHALPVRYAVCVHPSFTEAEAALRQTGSAVTHVMRAAGDWALDPEQVSEDADLVVLANPNNPTGNLDPPARIVQLARPGRTLVVDESFIDFVPGEQSTLAGRREVPGLVVLRSLTKVWGLAGLRAGYLLGPAELLARLQDHRQPWSVSAPALAAIQTCVPDLHTTARIAAEVAAAREDLRRRLARVDGVKSWPAQANFVLIEVPDGHVLVSRLASEGIAVRPCDSFPGLGANHIRLTVRTPAEHAVLVAAIARALGGSPHAASPRSRSTAFGRLSPHATSPRSRSTAFATVTGTDRFPRPPMPPGFDASRASRRAADPTGWRYPEHQREVVHRVIAERRDVRRFRAEDVPDEVLERVLEAAHRAPSVGLMQPWRLIVISDVATRTAVRRLAQRERLRQADRFDERAREFLDKKIEGVLEAPLGICVCCDHGEPDAEVLGRGTIPETDVYSTACAIENLWLAARAEGLGVGWVSFYRPADLRVLLGIPTRVDPIAYLCLGWPDERPVRPSLETAGWSSRLPLDAVLMHGRWREEESEAPAGDAAKTPPEDRPPRPVGPNRAAAIAARDRLDELTKPAGSLGTLEATIERWAAITGRPPPPSVRAGVLVCAADHGHVRHGTSLFDGAVSAQVAAAAARGETAVGVLARRAGHELLVVDVGLASPTPPGVRDAKIAHGSADMTTGPALSPEQLDAARAAGAALARELARRGVDCIVLGEIGIGNTTTSAALACALTNAPPQVMVGRGTGVDAAGLERKRAIVASALERHGAPLPAREALRTVGGLELAALAGAACEAARLRLPVLLDGYAVTAAVLAAVGLEATIAESLIAGHRSAEPGHDLLLAELGLEPQLDLRLRLGEASGALLALPLIEAAGALHSEMGTFAESGVARAG